MTKNRIAFLCILAMASTYLFAPKKESTHASKKAPKVVFKDMTTTPTIPEAPRQFVGPDRKVISRVPASISYINKPSADWEQNLHKSLTEQAGNKIKEITIKKENSLVWLRDNNGLMVESVVIAIKNNKDNQSSFRALVDSQTGKVLETWDRTIFDNIDKSEEFRFKLDPRYSN